LSVPQKLSEDLRLRQLANSSRCVNLGKDHFTLMIHHAKRRYGTHEG